MVAQAIQSVISMLILMLIGAWLAGKDWFRKSGGTGLLSKLIVNVLVPLYMLNNVLTKVGTRQKLWEIVVCLPLPMITIFISLALGIWMAGRLGIHAPRRGVFINVMTFTNCVLVGFPIIISLFGEEAAAVGMVYYMVNTICFWTIGVQLLREDGGQKSSLFSKAGLKKLLSPPLLGFLLGVVLVILGLSLPAVLANPVSQLGSCATPMAMMFVGCILRDADWSKLRISRDLLLVLLFRFIVCPMLMLGVVYVMPLPALNKQVFFLLSSMPAMTQLSVMSKESGSDVEFASLLIAVTTVLSIFMIPVYAWIVTLVL